MDNANAMPPTAVGGLPVTRIIPREATDSCHPQPNVNKCEKPAISNTKLFVILTIFSVVIVGAFLVLLFFLHRRRRRLDQAEAPKDLQELDDYGLAPESSPPPKRTQMPAVPPPVQPNSYSHNNYERAQTQGPTKTTRSGDWRTSAESLTPSFRQATPAVPRDGLSNMI